MAIGMSVFKFFKTETMKIKLSLHDYNGSLLIYITSELSENSAHFILYCHNMLQMKRVWVHETSTHFKLISLA